jgi:hypothetical protein
MSIDQAASKLCQSISRSFNHLAESVKSGALSPAEVQSVLLKQILTAPTDEVKRIWTEGYKTVFPDAKL